jgi:uncharacterized protein YndB with AHSA1/START domain
MAIAIDETTRLELRRSLKAPVGAVYAAWTDPEEMKHWMAPSDDYRTDVTSDFRVGGRYRIVMEAPGQETHRVGGEFREIVPLTRLVYTWAWESTPERESLVTVEFRAAGAGTEVSITHERFADRDARDRHRAGWHGCLARYERHLSRSTH